MTAALERLLDVEVGATEARKLASRLRFACLPEPWTINALAEGAMVLATLMKAGSRERWARLIQRSMRAGICSG